MGEKNKREDGDDVVEIDGFIFYDINTAALCAVRSPPNAFHRSCTLGCSLMLEQEAKGWPATALPWRLTMWRCLGMLELPGE
ncbi:hypothetical protein D4764_11G0006070 [Takifugu flavidus]|uniref:Uncharacterized protein n=1 Tax=Takifugu flavidus TaxID=433684 RepID=A0A5C6PHW0_9TELE|nr:hypothetical protein D4764_11G0006070 [Takifugu flavidus]